MRRSWLMLWLLAGCAAPVTRAPDALIDVKLIAFNDLHGHVQAPGSGTRTRAASSIAT